MLASKFAFIFRAIILSIGYSYCVTTFCINWIYFWFSLLMLYFGLLRSLWILAFNVPGIIYTVIKALFKFWIIQRNLPPPEPSPPAEVTAVTKSKRAPRPRSTVLRLTQCRRCTKDMNTIYTVCTFACGHVFHRRCLPISKTSQIPESCPECTVPVESLKNQHQVKSGYRFRELPGNVPEGVSECTHCGQAIPIQQPPNCQLTCGHLFHVDCIEDLLTLNGRRCPVCFALAEIKELGPRLNRQRKLKVQEPNLEVIVED